MANSELRQYNLDFLKQAAPTLHGVLAAAEGPAAGQSPAALQNPTFVARVSIDPPRPDGRDPYLGRFIGGLIERACEEDTPFFDEPAFTLSTALAVVGDPAPDALADMVGRTRCIYLFVVVDDTGRFAAQLDRQDWPAVADRVRRRGGQIFFILGGDAVQISGEICSTLASTAPAAIDGLALTAFGQGTLAKELADTLGRLGFRALATLGTFYDECLMLRNSEQNLRRPNILLYRNRTRLRPGIAALIVGSGPSLDADLPFLAGHQDKAVIISCGSALAALLAAGIRPDFHVELENIDVMPTLRPAAERHDLSGIPLIAPASVDPEAARHFDRIVFGFRPNLCNQPLYGLDDGSQPILCEPTVVNLALAFARERNFPEICFFGVDMGTRAQQADHDHAKGTWHRDTASGYRAVAYDIAVPANFGGTSYTSTGLYQALHALSLAVSRDASGRHYFNYSDGAEIAGARPLRAADMRPTPPGRPKAKIVQDILADFPPWDPTRLPDPWPGAEMCRVIEDRLAATRGLLKGIRDFSDKAYLPAIGQLFRYGAGHLAPAPPGPESSANILIRGAVGAMMLFMEYYLNRVTTPADQAKVGQACVALIDAALDDLMADVRDRIGGDGVRNVPEFNDIRLPADARFPAHPTVPRNAPCPCGSGKRYKACHGVV
ncbi:MAG: hypothetical protein COW30_09125 [Rhodospirillales bacterium CG15_BIG_FIL_POST_REV_8_21_14_020_66_15]|nr:MAG: hypothetical protein COW30_09125 [Rhodospirillales bacterium CG15_BIG_FIL_POST_REV_8_21_14_020_66_15]